MKRSAKPQNTNKIGKKEFDNWLLTAIPFSVWRWSNKKHIIKARDFIFKEIGEEFRYGRERALDKDMLNSLLVNLWVGFSCGCPIQISLNANRYTGNGAYSQVFFSYRRTYRLFKKLNAKGYIQFKKGYFFDEDKKETRMWGTEKLIKLFVGYNFQPVGDVFTINPVQVIQLRNEKKENHINKKTGKEEEVTIHIPVPFHETESTQLMKKNLLNYNDLVNKQTVSLRLQGKDIMTPKVLVNEILLGLVSGSIKLINAELDYKNPVDNNKFYSDNSTVSDSSKQPVLSVFSDIPGLMITSISYDKYSYPTIQYSNDMKYYNNIEIMNNDAILSSITNTLHSQQWQCFQEKTTLFLYLFYIKKMLSLIKFNGRNKDARQKQRESFMESEYRLIDFGIKHLECEMKKKSLHRVFNRASLEFDKGGRFYGAFYQGISGDIRKRILINGNETVELDYSGHHLRMLYHQLGQKYEKDPYDFAWEEERKKYRLSGEALEKKKKEVRNKYKLVGLISINSEETCAPSAIRKVLIEAGIPYGSGKGCIKTLMENMKKHHATIKDLLFKGVGVDLQNDDSKIMDDILAELTRKGIVGLPIHDSIIVEKQHEKLLETLMIEKYRKHMNGFEPVLKAA